VRSSKFTCSFLTFADFGNGYQDPFSHTYAIQPDLLGVISAAYNMGGILAVPGINQWFGRRWAIMPGSISMMCGAILQGFS
jgi:hypothetical protein